MIRGKPGYVIAEMDIDSDIIVKAGLAIDIIGAFFIFSDFLGLPLIRVINNNSKRMVGEFASLLLLQNCK